MARSMLRSRRCRRRSGGGSGIPPISPTRSTTSVGHDASYDFDANGRLHGVTLGHDPGWMQWVPATLDGAPQARPPWSVSIERNARGEEVARRLPGGVVSRWDDDVVGRPVTRTTERQGEALMATRYQWRATDEIAVRVNAATGATSMTSVDT